MIQVWEIDNEGYFTGESDFKEERKLTQFDVTEAIDVGYIKPRWNSSKWIEGATEEEIKQFEEDISKPPEPTELDKLKELVLAQQEEMLIHDEFATDLDFRMTNLELRL